MINSEEFVTVNYFVVKEGEEQEVGKEYCGHVVERWDLPEENKK